MEQRFEKVSLFRSDTDQTKGVLVAGGDTLRFESKKGTLTMPKIRALSIDKKRLTVEYGEGENFGTATFVDLSQGAFKWRAATQELEGKLRAILRIVPIGAHEQPGYERAQVARKVATGKQGRTQMWIGAALVVVGVVVTIWTYSSADPGDRYFLLWGPIIFGAILFFQGLAASVRARR